MAKMWGGASEREVVIGGVVMMMQQLKCAWATLCTCGMVARNACEGVKKTRCDNSYGSSGAESIDVAHSRLLLREVSSDSKVPNDGQSRMGDAGHSDQELPNAGT